MVSHLAVARQKLDDHERFNIAFSLCGGGLDFDVFVALSSKDPLKPEAEPGSKQTDTKMVQCLRKYATDALNRINNAMYECMVQAFQEAKGTVMTTALLDRADGTCAEKANLGFKKDLSFASPGQPLKLFTVQRKSSESEGVELVVGAEWIEKAMQQVLQEAVTIPPTTLPTTPPFPRRAGGGHAVKRA